MKSKIGCEEYTFESPIISRLPAKFYDDHITEDMHADEVYFGYKSYNELSQKIEIQTGNGWIEFDGGLFNSIQVTVKLKKSSPSLQRWIGDQKYYIPEYCVHNFYHPCRGDNAAEWKDVTE